MNSDLFIQAVIVTCLPRNTYCLAFCGCREVLPSRRSFFSYCAFRKIADAVALSRAILQKVLDIIVGSVIGYIHQLYERE